MALAGVVVEWWETFRASMLSKMYGMFAHPRHSYRTQCTKAQPCGIQDSLVSHEASYIVPTNVTVKSSCVLAGLSGVPRDYQQCAVKLGQ